MSPFLEVTVLNAGLGFYANGKVDSIKGRIALAWSGASAFEKLRLLQGIKMSQEFLPKILKERHVKWLRWKKSTFAQATCMIT